VGTPRRFSHGNAPLHAWAGNSIYPGALWLLRSGNIGTYTILSNRSTWLVTLKALSYVTYGDINVRQINILLFDYNLWTEPKNETGRTKFENVCKQPKNKSITLAPLSHLPLLTYIISEPLPKALCIQHPAISLELRDNWQLVCLKVKRFQPYPGHTYTGVTWGAEMVPGLHVNLYPCTDKFYSTFFNRA